MDIATETAGDKLTVKLDGRLDAVRQLTDRPDILAVIDAHLTSLEAGIDE